MVDHLLKNLKISWKVGLGFGAVLLTGLLVGSSGYWSMSMLRQSVDDSRRLNSRAVRIMKLDLQIVELHRGVALFTYTGYESVKDEVNKRLTDLLAETAATGEKFSNLQAKSLLLRVSDHLRRYQDAFQAAVEQRARREQTFAKIQKSRGRILREFGKSSAGKNNWQGTFLSAHDGLVTYLRDPDYKAVGTSLETLDRLIKQANQSGQKNFADMLGEYRQAYVQVVQQTRGYLYLISVVMAGEAHEVSYLANDLRAFVVSLSKAAIDESNKVSDRAQSTAVYVMLAALFFGGLVAFLLSRNIAVPLTRITATFKDLATGQSDTEIPGTERGDEIGTLAQAADVFRSKNRDTKMLLGESKRLAAELEQRRNDLERSNDELDQFVYTVSHDLKAPIVTASGFIGMIEELAATGKYREAVEKVPRLANANKRMSQLITDLLNLSRVGRVDLDIAPVDLNSIARTVSEIFAPVLHEKGISLKIQKDLPQIRANESRTMQVFENLLSNAIKYGENPNGPTIDIGYQEDSGRHKIFFKDNGPGIRQEHHALVFGLFQRLRQDNDGTGIGLSIVQKVMKFHSGRVWIESVGGGSGCTFWLEFPKNVHLEARSLT